MTDAEYVEELATEVDALIAEAKAIQDRIDSWWAEAFDAGIVSHELADAITRKLLARETALALKPGQEELKL